jgi:hypothetical protein
MKLDHDATHGRKDLTSPQGRWEHHLKPFFGEVKACAADFLMLERYIAQRKAEGAAPASINKEIAVIKRAFHLAKKAKLVTEVPSFPERLNEDAYVRKGFLRPGEQERIPQAAAADGPWALGWLAIATTNGWRRGGCSGAS